MKKILLLLSSFAIIISLFGQSVPQGMKYQAVARDLNGEILANQDISLKITLHAQIETDKNYEEYYAEAHSIITNQFGLFSIVIGEGEILSDRFEQIPWSKREIWMTVAIWDDDIRSYSVINSSKLLAVPYAFHSGTASKLENAIEIESGGMGIIAGGNGPNQNTRSQGTEGAWIVRGNANTNPDKEKLGTIDSADLVIVTNDRERIRLTSEGGINVMNALNIRDSVIIDDDLQVHGNSRFRDNVVLNSKRGMTINHGKFLVENQSLTHLTGDLIVSGELIADYKSILRYTLEVLGESDFNSTLRVNNMSPTFLSGDLNVGGNTSLDGGLSVGTDLDIGGNLNVDGTTDLNNTLSVDGETDINNVFRVNNMNPTILSGSLSVEKGTLLQSTLGVQGATTLNGTLLANKQVTIHADFNGAQDDYNVYPLRVEGGDHGIAIKVNGTNPQRNTNWLTLFDGSGNAKGRIEGFQGLTGIARNIIITALNEPEEEEAEGSSQDKNQAPASVPPSAEQYFNNDYAVGALSETLDLVNAIIGLATNVIACLAGIGIAGDCDDAIWSAVDVICQGIQLSGHIVYHEVNLGAAFESGGADYAEWLLKAEPTEAIHFGDVVGVNGGLISKEFETAERFMVISNNPTVIGAMPQEGEEDAFEKVAFMGQVPVKVMGEVQRGDYILPSGNGDGLATAVHPDEMKVLDYRRIIGTAWTESDGEKLFEYINVAVGINSNDLAGEIDKMQTLLNKIQTALQEVNPEYQATFYTTSENSEAEIVGNPTYTSYPNMQQRAAEQIGISKFTTQKEAFEKIRMYAQNQEMDFEHMPYVEELMANPNNLELAEQTLKHYEIVLQRLTAIMNQIQKG